MRLAIALFIIICPGLLIAQNQKPIDEIGWDLPEIPIPNSFTPLDSGTVTYLLTLTKSGRVKNVKVLSSTFNKEAEYKLTSEVQRMALTKREIESNRISYKGTFQISLNACITMKNGICEPAQN